MPSTNLYRASGLALLCGAALGIIGNVTSSALYPGSDPQQYRSAVWLVLTLSSFIGEALLLLGLPGIAARLSPRAGWLGLAGFVLAFLGGLLLAGVSAVELLIFPWLAQASPNLITSAPLSFFIFFFAASVLFGVGGLLLGLAVMRSGAFARAAGVLLLAGGVLTIVGSALSGTISNLLAALPFVIVAAGLGWIGHALSSGERSGTPEPVD